MSESKFNLKDLKQELPYKWRTQSTNQWGATCVAYIDSRDAQDLLDEVVGAENWSTKYYEVKGNLYCSVGILINGEWVYKSDCGTESSAEQQKGEASDAFKRACVQWGIGRFLYSMGIVKIKEVIEKNGRYYPASNGKQIWDITKHIGGGTMKATPKVNTKEALIKFAKDIKSDVEASLMKNKEGSIDMPDLLKIINTTYSKQ